MKTFISSIVTLIALTSTVIYGAHHKGSKELELLALLAGNYTYEFTGATLETVNGKLSAELFANDQFLKFDEKFDVNDPDSVEVLGIVGYDKVEKYFTWHRVFSNGSYDIGRGLLRNGIITFNITTSRLEAFGEKAWAGPGVKARTKWMNISEKGFDVVWERSKDGGPWEQMGKGHLKKKR